MLIEKPNFEIGGDIFPYDTFLALLRSANITDPESLSDNSNQNFMSILQASYERQQALLIVSATNIDHRKWHHDRTYFAGDPNNEYILLKIDKPIEKGSYPTHISYVSNTPGQTTEDSIDLVISSGTNVISILQNSPSYITPEMETDPRMLRRFKKFLLGKWSFERSLKRTVRTDEFEVETSYDLYPHTFRINQHTRPRNQESVVPALSVLDMGGSLSMSLWQPDGKGLCGVEYNIEADGSYHMKFDPRLYKLNPNDPNLAQFMVRSLSNDKYFEVPMLIDPQDVYAKLAKGIPAIYFDIKDR
ncbi:hypothetical protein HYT02_03265 [Candidatus Gottesmanbacteria bacterium]|nr:hypothetical protein [Candidatus Gottesmanbacteria bacterium]